MRRVPVILTTVGALATAYSILIATLWALEVADMRSTTASLSDTLASEQSSVDQLQTEVDGLAVSVQSNLDRITAMAHDRAKAQDDELLLGDVSFALEECANERKDVAHYVKTRFQEHWIVSDIHAYETDVNNYCQLAHDIYTGLLSDEGTA